MPRFVAVIDIGKTNYKLAIVDTETAEEIQLIKEPAAVIAETLYPSLDHWAIRYFIFDALKKLSIAQRIDAITVTTHGATAALLTKDGELALPVMDYEFDGIDELRDEYEERRPSFHDTGSPALPGGLNIGAQLYWLQSRHNKQFLLAHTLLTWPQYWVYTLTGKRINDVSSLGCHTDLYEPRNNRYSELVDRLKWRSLMPPASHSGKYNGNLTHHIAARLDLPPTTPVYTGIHDSNASLVPHLLSQKPPYSVVSTGTWFISMAIGGTPTILDVARDTLLNVNAQGKPVPSARFMGGREREELKTGDVSNRQSMHRLLQMESSPPMLMPSVVPNTGPYPSATKRWLNIDRVVDKSILDCAVTLYLALMTNECMQLIGCNGPTFIEGPLAHDECYAQMLAAVSGRDVSVSESQTGTSVGAAMLISPPKIFPAYRDVKVDSETRNKLRRYAALWQHELRDHSR